MNNRKRFDPPEPIPTGEPAVPPGGNMSKKPMEPSSAFTLAHLELALRRTGTLLLLVLLTGAVSGGSCFYEYDDDDCRRIDDDDFRCFDDDDQPLQPDEENPTDDRTQGESQGLAESKSSLSNPSLSNPTVSGAALGELTLREYRLSHSERSDGSPVLYYTDIGGVSLLRSSSRTGFTSTGSDSSRGSYGSEEFFLFSERILEANQPLLGLPTTAGALERGEVLFSDTVIAVSFAQWVEEPGGRTRSIEDGFVRFFYDRFGRLFEIENSTRVDLQ